MKVLVLGGTRFFGKRLVHLLIEEGHEVTILSRGNQKDDFGNKVSRLIADRKDKKAMKKVIGDNHFDAVIDQICMTAEDARDSIEIFKDRTPYYLMTSTMSVYSQKANLKEEDFNPLTYKPQVANDFGEQYAEGKRAAEKFFMTEAPFICSFARFPVVLGEDDYTRRLYDQVKRVQNERHIYYPNIHAKFSFIQSMDAARALRWLLHTKSSGPYNFAAEDPVVLRDLISKIESLAQKKAHLLSASDEEAYSPFGIGSDWFLNVEKAKKEGFECLETSQWLDQLILKLL